MAEERLQYVLDREQAAAAIAAAGISDPGSLLSDLAGGAAGSDVLQRTGLLDDDGTLWPALASALRTAASPARSIMVSVVTPGSTGAASARLVARDAGWVAVATGDGLALRYAPDDLEAALMVDEMLDLSTFPGQPEETVERLSAHGWAALVAASDVAREHQLRADLARAGIPGLASFDAPHLEGALETGLDRADSRWAVTAVGVVNAVDLSASSGHLEAGLGDLEEAGIVTALDSGWSFTPRGAEIAEALSNAIRIGSVTPALVLLGIWEGLGDEPSITLIQPDAASAIQYVAELMAIGRR
jgi:hypothetical protein